MYSPTLGKFLTRDPLAQNGEPDILYGDAWFNNRLKMRNLYDYVDNCPLNLTDPSGLFADVGNQGNGGTQTKPESFYVCKRLVDVAGTARKCGCQHTAIYGDQSGEVYDGWFGPTKPPKGGVIGGGIPKGKEWKCTKLTMTDVDFVGGFITVPKLFSWGPMAGKSCANATPADILACLQAKPPPSGEPGLVKNCQTDVRDAAQGCCITGYTPLTIGLPDYTTLPP